MHRHVHDYETAFRHSAVNAHRNRMSHQAVPGIPEEPPLRFVDLDSVWGSDTERWPGMHVARYGLS